LNGRIRRFAESQGRASVGNYTARDGHDNASGVALDGNRMIWTWKLHLLFFSSLGLLFWHAQLFRKCVTCSALGIVLR
jgi:hypothetical protein